jgi:polyisoprenoid-binding protein YceI
MRKHILGWLMAAVLCSVALAQAARAADDFGVDPMHAAAGFTISHLGLSWTQGRFDGLSGAFSIDGADPSQSSFALTINATTVNTNNAQRDEHLRSPDFFNVKQFPAITFKSTAVKGAKDGYEVTGDLTMHGVTRSITLPLTGGKQAEFPKGVQRTGFSTQLRLKRSEFGMDHFAEAVGDDVYVNVSFEGTKK